MSILSKVLNKNINFYLILVCLSLINKNSRPNQNNWSEQLNLDQIEYQLIHEKIINTIPLFINKFNKSSPSSKLFYKAATNGIQLVTLKSGLQAIYKPIEIYNYAEVAAYNASKFLNLSLVPPTVLRTINGVEGSLQFYVKNAIPLSEWEPDQIELKKALSLVSKKNITDALIFCFILGQFDINFKYMHNILLVKINNERVRLLVIDNASCIMLQKIKYGSLPFLKIGITLNKQLDQTNEPFTFEPATTVSKEIIDITVNKLKEFNAESPLGFFNAESALRFFTTYLSDRQSLKYTIWDNALWLQMPPIHQRNYTSIYFKSTLEAIKKLTPENLKLIWKEAYEKNDTRVLDLYVKLHNDILERRNQVLKASQNAIIK